MDLVKRFRNSKWMVPAWLLFLTILAYGLLVPALGFYFDDWPVIYLIQSKANFWEFYQFDRPFSAWTYVLTAPVLGTSPILWHSFTLLLRWLTSLLLWWVLKSIWPNHLKEANWVAFIFAVHPVFLQQSIAVAYSQHFITYALFLLSCGMMLYAVQKPGRTWLFLGLSIISAILHIFTMEYFWGVELVRPLLLWVALSNQGGRRKEVIRKTIGYWLPFLVVLVAAIIWRVGFYGKEFASGEDPNSLRLLSRLIVSPLDGSINFIEMVVRDFIFMMVSVWTRLIQPGLIEIKRTFVGFSWILVGISYFLFWFFRTKVDSPGEQDQPQVDSSWCQQAAVLGIVIFILGTLPVWLTDKYISTGMYADRFALPGMLGASILLVGLLSSIGIRYKSRSIILSIMISLAIGAHFRVSNDFRWDWVNQKRFFWQLYWRAPELEPGTTVFSDGSIFSFAGEYPTAFAINAFYGSENNVTELPYWFIELDSGFHRDPDAYLSGINLSKSLRNYSFLGNSLHSIVLDFNPDSGSCLWILDERDRINLSMPGLTWEALPLSDLDRIHSDRSSILFPSKAIFGREPDHTWCYYYQNATAARHNGDWEGVLQIKDVVDELGYGPNNRLEWIPFIDAYARLGRWAEAGELTLSAYERAPIARKTFCTLWDSFSEMDLDSAPASNSIDAVIRTLGCD